MHGGALHTEIFEGSLSAVKKADFTPGYDNNKNSIDMEREFIFIYLFIVYQVRVKLEMRKKFKSERIVKINYQLRFFINIRNISTTKSFPVLLC